MKLNGSCSGWLGDVITFGDYDWRVLDVQDGKTLLITERIIDIQPYNVEYADVTWESSTIRAWLNNEFYGSFSSAERERIASVNIFNPNNPWYGTDGGDYTMDKVFLLSIDELVRYYVEDYGTFRNDNTDNGYFSDDSNYDRQARGEYPLFSEENVGERWTDANSYGDNYTYDNEIASMDRLLLAAGESFKWWLRSPGSNENCASFVSYDGRIEVSGFYVDYFGIGVRPAIWVELN